MEGSGGGLLPAVEGRSLDEDEDEDEDEDTFLSNIDRVKQRT